MSLDRHTQKLKCWLKLGSGVSSIGCDELSVIGCNVKTKAMLTIKSLLYSHSLVTFRGHLKVAAYRSLPSQYLREIREIQGVCSNGRSESSIKIKQQYPQLNKNKMASNTKLYKEV